MIKKKILRILLFILFLITSLVLFKKFNKYITYANYTKLLIILIIAISFLIGSLKDKFLKPIGLFLTYFILILYSVNFLIVLFDYNNTSQKKIEKILKKEGKTFDNRKLLDVVKDERLKGKEIYPYVVPREFLKKNNSHDIILTPMPHTEYVSCNEFGLWKKIKTDKFGFNNDKFFENFDILLLGDSFAEGSCVNKENEPAKLFKKNFKKVTYNIGVSGNGPILSLALAHEIKSFVNFDHLVWLIFDNDFYDLNIEINSNFLNRYLKEDFEGYNYFSNLDASKIKQKKYIKNNFESFKKHYSFKENLFELKPLIYRINKLMTRGELEDNFSFDKKNLELVFDKIGHLYPEKKIYVIYLPESTCFVSRSKSCQERFEILKNSSDNIVFLNFYKFIKENIKDYTKMYALGQARAHYSNEGYELLISFINNNLK